MATKEIKSKLSKNEVAPGFARDWVEFKDPADPENIYKISEKVSNDISTKLALNFSSGDTGLNFKEL
jgi:hypothetical protein